ncbi:MAG: undecaprenyl-diphosphate phosphatase [Patescibacteria group bacterium]
MSLLQSLFLGLLQGATEFLPISSSGHLVILPKLFGWSSQPLVFDTTLHLGTGLAILIYFWRDLWGYLLKDRKKLLLILVGSAPAAILGFFLSDYLENYFREPVWVALFLILGSGLLWSAQKFAKAVSEDVSPKKALSIGLFQALALFPGVSRSGATISGGMFLGLTKTSAAKFSFLLSLPIILGAGLFQISDSLEQISHIPYLSLLVGFFASFLSGLVFISFLTGFVKKHSLNIFVVYRLVLAGVIIATLC